MKTNCSVSTSGHDSSTIREIEKDTLKLEYLFIKINLLFTTGPKTEKN